MTSSNFRAASTARTRPHKSGAAPIPLVFPFILWNRALAALSCAFCRPHLPKVLCGTAAASFFNILKYECKSSFRHSPVPFLSTVFPHWGAEPRKCRNRDSTSATPEATLPEKNQSVSRTKAFHRWTHTLPTLLLFSAASTRELLLLTMFLPWWQDYRTAPGHSSRVTRKFSN